MSEIKIFKDFHEPVKVQLQSIDGQVYDLESRFMPTSEMRKFEMIGYKQINPESDKEEEQTETDKICKMMTFLFGKDHNFWLQFSLTMLKDVIDYVTEITKKNLKK